MPYTGGGIISLNMGNGRAKLPGLFVAPGAVGLFLGTYWNNFQYANNLILIFLLLCAIGFMTFVTPSEEIQKNLAKKSDFPIYMLIIICLLTFSSSLSSCFTL